MRSFEKLSIEVILIAIIACILIFPIHFLMTGDLIPRGEGTAPMFIGSVILVSSIHLIFEAIGWNESWCRNEYKL